MFLDTKQETRFTRLLAASLHAKSCTPYRQKEGSGRPLAGEPQHQHFLVPHQPAHGTASEPAGLKASRILPESFAKHEVGILCQKRELIPFFTLCSPTQLCYSRLYQKWPLHLGQPSFTKHLKEKRLLLETIPRTFFVVHLGTSVLASCKEQHIPGTGWNTPSLINLHWLPVLHTLGALCPFLYFLFLVSDVFLVLQHKPTVSLLPEKQPPCA